MIKYALQLLANLFGWGMQREGLNNSPEVQAAKVAQKEQVQVDATTKAVAAKDIEEERREFSES